MSKKFDLKVKIIKLDNELAQKRTLCWLQNQKIDFESSASNIQDQNDVAECSENVITKKMHAMQISESLSYNLWKKIINCVVYLYNQISQKAQSWKTSYKVFYSNVEEDFLLTLFRHSAFSSEFSQLHQLLFCM